MRLREARLAGSWYDGTRSGCARAIEQFVRNYSPPAELGRIHAGVVPHAGWAYSGPTAAKVFAAIRAQAIPEVFVLFGAVHRVHTTRPAADTHDAWETPLGPLPVDDELRRAVTEEQGSPIVLDSAPLRPPENSLEVQMPLIRGLFDEVHILPIGVPPVPEAVAAGRAAAAAAKRLGRRAVFLASSDLTHYGMNYADEGHGPLPAALPWMKQNDRRIIALMERLDAAAILAEAESHHNACGPGALAAGTAAAVAAGATAAYVLEYTTSMDVTGDRWAGSAVGYVGLVFHTPPSV